MYGIFGNDDGFGGFQCNSKGRVPVEVFFCYRNNDGVFSGRRVERQQVDPSFMRAVEGADSKKDKDHCQQDNYE